jgi:hypothetical protein
LPNNARAILRIVLRHEHQRYGNQELDMFLNLKTRGREIHDRNKEQWDRILLSARAVKEYSGTNMMEEMISSFFAKVSDREPSKSIDFHGVMR